MKKEWDRFLKAAIRAAKQAGDIQRRGLGKPHHIQYKGEINLVTEVDCACESAIVKILQKEFPGHDFLMEESGKIEKQSDYKWIIDPLDGTTNFAHGYPLFCVSIGLEYKKKIILGVVLDPNRKELFVGIRGGGATLNGRRIRVSKVSRLKQALLVTGFAYDVYEKKNNNLKNFSNFILNAQAVRRDGVAALDLCYVACGRYDGFWEMDLWPWDISAGSLILEEAGGQVTAFDGSTFNLYGKETLSSNGLIHPEMVKLFNDHATS